MINKMNGQVLSLAEIDNNMVEYGYYSVYADGIYEEVLRDGNIAYTSTETNEVEIIIEFNVVEEATDDEDISATIVVVTDIREF
jgi:pyruvate formate-lyase activating enzyme-like uncharacterized protein